MEELKLLKLYEEPEAVIKRFNTADIIMVSRLSTDPSDNDNSDPFGDLPW